jgi:hypothetical protein
LKQAVKRFAAPFDALLNSFAQRGNLVDVARGLETSQAALS